MITKEKYKKAFDVLASSEQLYLEVDEMTNKKQKIPFMAVIAAATIAIGSLTVGAAAYLNWNNGLTKQLHIDEEQQKTLEESDMAVFGGVSSTDAGVTVTAETCITDNYYTYLSFKIEGYEVASNLQPEFEKMEVSIDGDPFFEINSSFYSGEIWDSHGRPIYEEGMIDAQEQSSNHTYVMGDGSLEYHMLLSNRFEPGYFTGKTIHVTFYNLGTVSKAQYDPAITGKWEMEWTLGENVTTQVFDMDEKLGDSGATIKKVEISPLSISILYDFPLLETWVTEYDENGEYMEYPEYEEPPYLTGLMKKDGELLMEVWGGTGTGGYSSDKAAETGEYSVVAPFLYMIDIGEVGALRFVNNKSEYGESVLHENPVEDMIYYVPLN